MKIDLAAKSHFRPANGFDMPITAITSTQKEAPFHPKVLGLSAAHRPHVSVIVLCYNYAHWLAGCVDSVLEQEGVEVDVLIVNDASSDNSAEVAHRLAAEDSRVRVIDHKQNCGHIPSVNEALSHVPGDYIVKMDADDMLVGGSLARSTALLEAHPNVGFVYGRALHFGKHLDTLLPLHKWFRQRMFLMTDDPTANKIDTRVRSWTLWPGPTWVSLLCQRGANCISQPEVVMRASAIRAVGGYDGELPHTSDLAVWLRLASISDVGHIDGAIQGLYRFHLTSMQRTINSGRLVDLLGRLAAFETALGGHSQDAKLLRSARIALASEALTNACRSYDRGRTRSEPVEDYVSFALRAYPDARELPQWAKLQLRQRVGAVLCPYHPAFVLDAVTSRLAQEISAAYWWRHGVWSQARERHGPALKVSGGSRSW